MYLVKIIQNTSQKVTVIDNYDGLDIKMQTVRVKIPIWTEQINSEMHLEVYQRKNKLLRLIEIFMNVMLKMVLLQCRVWLHDTWNANSCKLIKLATIFNKPAAECLCSVVGYYA